jgi:hypothetical protein
MNFGKWIVVAFVLFAGFIATLVTVCMRQDIPLVTKEYYQEELKYQEQIVREQNTQQLAEKPDVTISENALKIQYAALSQVEGGELKLFRPSDPRLDQVFAIERSSGTSQTFQIENAEPGLYRARLTWQQQGREYFFEKIVVL